MIGHAEMPQRNACQMGLNAFPIVENPGGIGLPVQQGVPNAQAVGVLQHQMALTAIVAHQASYLGIFVAGFVRSIGFAVELGRSLDATVGFHHNATEVGLQHCRQG